MQHANQQTQKQFVILNLSNLKINSFSKMTIVLSSQSLSFLSFQKPTFPDCRCIKPHLHECINALCKL